MKKYLIIILLTLVACGTAKKSNINEIVQAQVPKYQSLKNFKGDTLQFIKSSILARKEFYEGKELNVLLKDLQMPVKKYVIGSESLNRNITPNLSLYIYADTDNKIKKNIDPAIITIKFETPLPRETTITLLRNNKGWTPEVSEYYGKQKIGELGKVIYNFK